MLITRPQQQADKWRALLEQQGASTLWVSMLEITPLTGARAQQQIKNKVMDFDHYRHAIFVSQNAAHYGGEWLTDYWPQWPEDVRFYAVGSATASMLERYDCEVVSAGAPDSPAVGTMNTEALLALPELQDVAGQKILIFRGQGGRPLLAEKLAERGAQVEYCELYSRERPQAALAQLQATDFAAGISVPSANDWVAIHSGESLQNWHEIITEAQQPSWLAQPLLIPGQRVAQLATELGFSNLQVAENASDSSMLATLLAALD